MFLRKLVIVSILSLLLAACSGSATSEAPDEQGGSISQATVVPASATASTEPVPDTREPLPTDEKTAEPTATVEEEMATPTLPPIRATAQALAGAVSVPTRSATVAPIAADDYVALTDQACRIVQENYVRDNFNGADWPALCETYRARAAEVQSQGAFWELMSDFIAELNDQHSRFVP
ncbi:MAG TPA: hypothetical protein VE553_10490, partial [Candidatus Binatia bacterium]|nr:hypothetical protein [Candidatus Binatia bacterium]